jgi:hypothetical protein
LQYAPLGPGESTRIALGPTEDLSVVSASYQLATQAYSNGKKAGPGEVLSCYEEKTVHGGHNCTIELENSGASAGGAFWARHARDAGDDRGKAKVARSDRGEVSPSAAELPDEPVPEAPEHGAALVNETSETEAEAQAARKPAKGGQKGKD